MKLGYITERHYWIHILFWVLLTIYFFAEPSLYTYGALKLVLVGILFYCTYGGAYFVAAKYITPFYFLKGKSLAGFGLIVLTACIQQLVLGSVSMLIMPLGGPFWQWFFFNLPFSVLLLFLASGITVFTDYLYVVRKVQQLELAKAKQEILFLKSQVNPHFLFNTLNSLYSLARSQSGKVEKVILQLSDLMRYMMEVSQREYVTLAEEIHFLSSYTAMEQLRLNDDAVCEINIAPNDYNQYRLPPLLLLPFVENAFKHGAEQNTGPVNIQINLTISDGQLLFTVINSFTVMTHTTTGTGLKNIIKRLDLLYGKKYELDISHQNNVYSATLKLQL